MNTRELETLGFSENEARVYLSCLERGRGSALAIATGAKLPKTTVSDVLKMLVRRNLVSMYSEKRKNYYVALSPLQLKKRLNKQMSILDEFLPRLESLYNSATIQPTLIRYEGESGVEMVFRQILDEATELIGISSAEDVYLKLSFFPDYLKERAKRKIPARIILRDCDAARKMQKEDVAELRKTKLVKTEVPYNAMILIWKNKIALVTLKSDYVAVVVESTDIVAAFKLIFELFWKQE